MFNISNISQIAILFTATISLPSVSMADYLKSTAFTPRYCTQQELAVSPSPKFGNQVSFTEAEIQAHKTKLPELLKAASGCVTDALIYKETFASAAENAGFSPYYGAGNGSALDALEQQYPDLPASTKKLLSERLIPVSCVGVALKCLEKGFVTAGLSDIWTKIHKFRCANHSSGVAIQYALRQLGWKTLHWSRNQHDDPNLREKAGKHFYGSKSVLVDNTNYLSNTVTDIPDWFKNIPFTVLSADDGFHVFMSVNSSETVSDFKLVEGHVGSGIARITDEYQAFEEQTPGILGPDGSYESGLVAIPPGYMP